MRRAVTLFHAINSIWLAVFLGMIGTGWRKYTLMRGRYSLWWLGAGLLAAAWVAFLLGYHWRVLGFSRAGIQRAAGRFALGWVVASLVSLVGIALLVTWDRLAYDRPTRGSENGRPEARNR